MKTSAPQTEKHARDTKVDSARGADRDRWRPGARSVGDISIIGHRPEAKVWRHLEAMAEQSSKARCLARFGEMGDDAPRCQDIVQKQAQADASPRVVSRPLWHSGPSADRSGRVPERGDSTGKPDCRVTEGRVSGRPTRALDESKRVARPVQRIKLDELAAMSKGIERVITERQIPSKGLNLWEIRTPPERLPVRPPGHIYLLGTAHSLRLEDIKGGGALITFLRGVEFSKVYSEIATDVSGIQIKPDFNDVFETIRQGPPPKSSRDAFLKYRKTLENREPELRQSSLDEMYAALALSGRPESAPRRTLGLETESGIRSQAAEQNRLDLGETQSRPSHKDLDLQNELVKEGNQRALFAMQSAYLREGLDHLDIEERNKHWVNNAVVRSGENQLWIVGASHLPGLVVRFQDKGFIATHI